MRAIILAGGRGTRLAPYTTALPKPLMPIGEMPIIEVVLRQLAAHGFDRVTMAVGHLAELMMAYCADGSRFGVSIDYSREREPLGTAGPIALVPQLDATFLVMNGDLLTTVDYRAMLEFHRANRAIATVATYRKKVKIDLGVLEFDELGHVARYVEKPTLEYAVSMGIYLFEPQVLEFVPAGVRLDLPELVMRLVSAGKSVAAYRHDGYWLDIGRHEDYETAVREFEARREQFLPQASKDAVGHL